MTKAVLRGTVVTLFATGLASVNLFAETYVWTGVADSHWTNAANWTVRGAPASSIPGVPGSGNLSVDWAAFDVECGTALFEGTPVRTVVDLDGLFSVSNVVIRGAGTPAITFGTSSAQYLPLRTLGCFTVESTVVNMPVFVASASASVGIKETTNAWKYPAKYVNNSAGELVLGRIGPAINKASFSGSWSIATVRFDGTGPIGIGSIDRTLSSSGVLNYFILGTKGKVTVDGAWVDIRNISLNGTSEVELKKGALIAFHYNNPNGFTTIANDCRIFGEGEIALTCDHLNDSRRSSFSFTKGKTLTLDCIVSATNRYNATRAKDQRVRVDGPGTLALTGDVRTWGDYLACVANSAIKVPSIGASGERSCLGSGTNVILAAGGKLLYSGPGEMTTRVIVISNSTEAVGCLGQQGSGIWRVASPVRMAANVSACELQLENKTGTAAELLTDLGTRETAFTLRKTGSGLWRLRGQNAYTGATLVDGGTLSVAAEGVLPAASEVTVAAGAVLAFESSAQTRIERHVASIAASGAGAQVSVGDGTTLVLAAVPDAGESGTLDFQTAGSARLLCPAAIGRTLERITLNGVTPVVDADGRICPDDDCGVTDEISARGGVIPDKPEGVIGITTDGNPADGPIVLGAESVNVDTLVQRTAADAVVSMKDKTFGVSRLALRGMSGGLTVGEKALDGRIRTDDLVLENGDLSSKLVINAALEPVAGDGMILKRQAGTAELNGLSGDWTVTNEEGRLVIGGESSARIRASVGWTAGGRQILEIAEGACVSGVVSVGCSGAAAGRFCLSGGEFRCDSAVADDTSVQGCLHVSGGKFVSPYFGVGRNALGVFEQTGGMVEVGASNSGIHVPWYGTSGRQGVLRLQGGTMTCQGNLTTVGVDSQMAQVFVDGGELEIDGRLVFGRNSWGGTFVSVRKGGAFKVELIHGGREASWFKDESRYSHGYVNFDGGTMRLGADDSAVFGLPVVDVTKDHLPVRLVLIGPGGAVIDTNGKTGCTVDVPLSAPTGNGLVAIRLSAPVKNLDMAPFVNLTQANASACGAAAVCDYDPQTRSVTNITVISPGINYTSLTATLKTGANVTLSGVTLTPVFGPVASGSFTKVGAGDLTLKAVCTYAGGTVVRGGTLVAGVDGAVPDGSVMIAGGTLDLNGKSVRITSLAVDLACPGGGLVGVSAASLPREIIVKNGQLAGADGRHKYDLMALPDGYPGGLPTLILEGNDDPGWKLSVANGKLRLKKDMGLTVIVR